MSIYHSMDFYKVPTLKTTPRARNQKLMALRSLLGSTSNVHLASNVTTILTFITTASLPVFALYINRIIQYALFSVWSPSLNIMLEILLCYK